MERSEQNPANHPLALRMGAIAFLTQNLMVGCIVGVYSVLIPAIEAGYHVTRELSSIGVPLVLVGMALTAPIAGVLITRVSLRRLMLFGATIMTVGYLILAMGGGVYIFILVYALLIGPALGINGNILPATLVTRWYNVNRGRMLGIVNMPLLAAGIAPGTSIVLERFGLSIAFAMLAALSAIMIIASLFVIDYPQAASAAEGEPSAEATNATELGIGQLLRSGPFWLLLAAFAAICTGASALAAHIVPMAIGWGVEPTRAAVLLSISSLGAMVGSPAFGWLTERLGGAPALAAGCVGAGLLWLLLMLRPDYLVLMLIVMLMGFASGGVIPMISMAISQTFGPENFSRVLGLMSLINLPPSVAGVPLAAIVYVHTGSYSGALAGLAGLSLFGALCCLNLAVKARALRSRPA